MIVTRSGGYGSARTLLRTLATGSSNNNAGTILRTFATSSSNGGTKPPRPRFGGRQGERQALLQQQLEKLERSMRDLGTAVDRNHQDIVSAESWARRIWQETGARIAAGVERVQEAVPYLQIITRAPRNVAGTLGVLLVGGYAVRATIYRKVAEESEELGKQVLQKNIQNVITTVDGVAKDPQTLNLLVVLLQQLLEDSTTRHNLLTLISDLLATPKIRLDLIDLLLVVFQDETLKRTTGEFLLGALDTSDARRMLQTQVADLVSVTVLDAGVQADAGVGIRRALKNAVMLRGKRGDAA